MTSPAANANGHRRRAIIARVRAESDHCGICDQLVDKSLNFTNQHGPRCTNPDCTGCIPDPMRGEVDEIIPRHLGGSPLQRSNCHLVCRRCNSMKAGRSLAWARQEAARRGWSGSSTAATGVTSQTIASLVQW